MARHGRKLAADARAVGAGVRSGTQQLTAVAIVVALAGMRLARPAPPVLSTSTAIAS